MHAGKPDTVVQFYTVAEAAQPKLTGDRLYRSGCIKDILPNLHPKTACRIYGA